MTYNIKTGKEKLRIWITIIRHGGLGHEVQEFTSVNPHLLKTQAHLVRETRAGKRWFAFHFLTMIDSSQVSERSFKL